MPQEPDILSTFGTTGTSRSKRRGRGQDGGSSEILSTFSTSDKGHGTFLEGFTQDAQGGKTWRDYVGYFNTAKDAEFYTELITNARAMSKGTATPEQERMVRDWHEFENQEKSFAYKVGAGLSELPAFAMEIAGGSKIVTGVGKAVTKKLAKEAVEEAVTKAAEKGIAAGLGQAALKGAGITATNEAIGLATGGSLVRTNALEKLVRDNFEFSEDEAGEVAVAMSQTQTQFLDALPVAIVDALIENSSEMAGGALGKLPFADQLVKLQTKVLGKLKGKSSKEIAQTIMEVGGYDGPVQEMLEEALGAGARELLGQAGPEELADLKGSFAAFVDNIGVTATVVGVPGVGGAVLDRALPGRQQGEEAIHPAEAEIDPRLAPPEEGVSTEAPETAPDAPVLDMAGESQEATNVDPVASQEADLAEGGPDTLTDTETTPAERLVAVANDMRRSGKVRELEPKTEAELDVVEFGGRAAPNVRFIEGRDGKPLPNAAAYFKGDLFLDVNSPDFGRRLVSHEWTHWLSDVAPDVYKGLLEFAQKSDKFQLDISRGIYKDKASAYGWRKLGADLQAEEALATHMEELTPFVDHLFSKEGQKDFAELIHHQPGILQKLLDFFREILGKQTSLERKFDELAKKVGMEGSRLNTFQAAKLAKMFTEAVRSVSELRGGETLARFRPSTETVGTSEGLEAKFAPPAKKRKSVVGHGNFVDDLNQATEARKIGGTQNNKGLANPMPGAHAEAAQDVVDDVRPDPRTVSDNELIDKAEVALRGNSFDKERKRISDKIRTGQSLDAHEVFEAQLIGGVLGERALKTGDLEASRQLYEFLDFYRDSGTQQARAFRARQAILKKRSLAGRVLLGELMSKLDPRTDAKLKKLSEEIRYAKGAKLKRLEAQRDKLITKQAKKHNQVRAALRSKGIDTDHLSGTDLETAQVGRTVFTTVGEVMATTKDMLREYALASMLMNPATQVRNVVGNLAQTGIEIGPQRTAESFVNMMLTPLGLRDHESAGFGEYGEMLKAAWPALKKAGANMVEGFAKQELITPTSKDQSQPEFSKFAEGRKHAIPNYIKIGKKRIPVPLGWMVRVPFGGLSGMDSFFKTFLGTMEVAARAHRTAKENGLKGKERAAFIKAEVDNTSSDSWEAAEEFSDQVYFTDLADKDKRPFLAALQNLAHTMRSTLDNVFPILPVGTLLFPFVNTPLRLGFVAARRSPLVWIRQSVNIARAPFLMEYPGGKNGFVRDTADSLVAFGFFMAIMSLLEGEDEDGLPILTGAGKGSTGERALQYRTAPPFTIKLPNGERISYRNREPFTFGLAAVADAYEAWVNAPEGDEATNAAKATFMAAMDLAENTSYIRTVGDLLSLRRYGADNATKQLVELIPRTLVYPFVPNIYKGIERAKDPYLRESRIRPYEDESVVDAALRRAPYRLSPGEHLAPPPKYDLWGRPLKKNTPHLPIMSRWVAELFPFASESTASGGGLTSMDLAMIQWNDMIERGEVVGTKLHPTPIAPTYRIKVRGEYVKHYWTDEEYEQIVRESGERTLKRLGSRKWKPREKDIELIRKTISNERRNAKRRVLRQRKRNG